MAMAVTFTACEPNNETTENETTGKSLIFCCGQDTITAGSIYTSSKLDEAYAELGITRFSPEINLIGDTNGEVTITVESLNETAIDVCVFGSCKRTIAALNYTITASGNISSATPLPLDIHYSVPVDVNTPQVFHAEALITAYYEGEEDNAVSFTLVMTDDAEEE